MNEIGRIMKREIKFRVWDKHLNKFIPWNCFIPLNDNNEYIVQQYVGMKDCDGKEIYEGDLLGGFCRIFEVKWGCIERTVVSKNEISSYDVEIPCFYFQPMDTLDEKLFPLVNNYNNQHDLETLQVIGNILETDCDHIRSHYKR